LSANIEYLVLQGAAVQGYGNALSNAIYGTSAGNLLDGDAGADAMYGGAGNDAYFLDNISDQVIESLNEGSDTVYASANYRLSANVEYLVLQGGAVQGYGNNLSNAIYGNSENNILDGGAGDDGMLGGAGNDVYIVDDAGDAIFENPGEGNDAVFSTAHFRLTANVENLVLQGTADLQGYGNNLSNAIYGNSGNNLIDGGAGTDMLDGGEGIDTLIGGAGDDVFVFIIGQASGDTIVDFAGNNAAMGDSLQFVGYGLGATFTNIDATHWQVNYDGGPVHETITFSNGAAIDPSDVLFA
jgi:Ca2+-binding RTX toxin-like protein